MVPSSMVERSKYLRRRGEEGLAGEGKGIQLLILNHWHFHTGLKRARLCMIRKMKIKKAKMAELVIPLI